MNRGRPVYIYLSIDSLPDCGDINPVWLCDAAGLAEPGLELMGLKAWGLCEAPSDPELLLKLFSQPADNRNWASGVSSDGA